MFVRDKDDCGVLGDFAAQNTIKKGSMIPNPGQTFGREVSMIYGNRIRLRAAERSDIPQFVRWLNDPEVRQFLLLNFPLSIADEEQWFENMQKCQPAEHVLVIEVDQESDWKAIGNTSFMDIDWRNRHAEIGIFIGEKDYWNRGYGSETIQLMLKHGFNTLNLNRIWLRVYAHNYRGIRAYEKVGFQHEGKLRQAVFLDGRYYDVMVMSVLQPEWLKDTVANNA